MQIHHSYVHNNCVDELLTRIINRGNTVLNLKSARVLKVLLGLFCSFIVTQSMTANGFPERFRETKSYSSPKSAIDSIVHNVFRSILVDQPTPMPTNSKTITDSITRKEFEDIAMVEVPEGCFTMGNTEEMASRPEGEQCFESPFWIGETEVTNSQFNIFLAEGGYSKKEFWTESGWIYYHGPNDDQRSNWKDNEYTADNQPIVAVSWYEAQAYTKWLTDRYRLAGLLSIEEVVRLPTEAEWEYAARGTQSVKYPWGNDWVSNNAVTQESKVKAPAEVGSIDVGKSWVGALDMIGNVWEWTNTIHSNGNTMFEYPYQANDGREDSTVDAYRIARGGSFLNLPVSASYRGNLFYPFTRYPEVGFRLVIGTPIS